MMTTNESSQSDDFVLKFIDSPSPIQIMNKNNATNNTFNNSTFCSQKYIHDLQWNEQTWLPESSTNADIVSKCNDGSLLNCTFNTSFGKSEQSSQEKLLLEKSFCDDNNSLCISQSKFPPFLSLNESIFNNSNNMVIIKEKDENDNFYGLPNQVKILLQKIKNITSLYDWQDECLNLEAIKKRQNLIYSLPTSGGKTLVAEILMLKEIICNKKNVIFVLPYVALVQEKIQSMAPFALELNFLLEEYAGGKGLYPPVKRRRKNSLYICTIEKAATLLNSLIENNRLNEIGMVVVDELHLIGEGGGRGATLEGFLTKLVFKNENIHIVGMSATIGNLGEIATFLQADLYTGNFRPVQLKEYMKCDDRIWLIDLHSEDMFVDEKKINYKYSETASKLDPDRIGGLVMDVVPNDSCLIFCSSRKNCENVALLMTRVLFRSLTEYKKNEKKKLLSDLKAEESVCPILSETIKFGVAYHHSGLTAEERRILEEAYRDGVICVLCCTTTLAAGVNLPARRVILRSPYIGSEFLNLSRYKQMVGRAGRAGMGEIGESILICKPSEIPKVQGLLNSKMEDCLSNLYIDMDRGINNLILSGVMLSLAPTRADLHQLVSKSLLTIQSSRLGLNMKKITDTVMIKLMKDHVLKVQEEPILQDNLIINIQSQMINDEISKDAGPSTVKEQKTTIIAIVKESPLKLSDLGRAAMKGSIEIQIAHYLYDDLKVAQEHLILLDDLHILYLITPYDSANQLKPIGSIYYDIVSNLPSSSMAVARVLGINEVTIAKLRDGIMPKNIDSRVVNKFYLTLIIYDLWQQTPLYVVADKYQINRGTIQNLLTTAASFATSLIRFCQELPEFWAFTELFTRFHKKLTYSSSPELEVLMELPAVKVRRARQLYNAGYKTLRAVASANPRELQERIKHLSRKLVNQIIAAANVLLLAKVEDLKDEAAEMMEGLDTSNVLYDQ